VNIFNLLGLRYISKSLNLHIVLGTQFKLCMQVLLIHLQQLRTGRYTLGVAMISVNVVLPNDQSSKQQLLFMYQAELFKSIVVPITLYSSATMGVYLALVVTIKDNYWANALLMT